VYLDPANDHSVKAKESFKLLQNDGLVINVADPENAIAQMRSLGVAS
jgi:hypothetical protein